MARRSKDNAIDWGAIERQYRLGKKSNKQLGDEFQVDSSSIGRRATKYGWVVDKSKEVDAVTNTLLIQNASGNANPNATPTQLEIKAAGQASADVVLRHRRDIGRMRGAWLDVMEDIDLLNSQAGRDAIATKEEMLAAGPEGETPEEEARRIARLERKLERIFSVSDRVDNAKKAGELLEKIVRMDREAFSIGKDDGGAPGLDDLLLRVISERS